MTDRVYMTVASFCLVEAIEKLKEDGCVELGLSKQDGHWLISFNLPCKKMPIANDDELLPEESRPPVDEPYVLTKNERLDAAGPLCCQSCIKIKACKQIYVESGKWPVPRDCFIPDRVKKYPQLDMDSCAECNIVHSCIARYDMDRANWKCAKGKVHLNFTEVHDAPCTPQMIAEADCEGDKAKCGDACHAKSKQKDD